MKKFLKIVWNIFAVIGILSTVVLLYALVDALYLAPKKQLNEYVQLLRTSGSYEKDTTAFEMKIIQDTVRAKEIRDYFQLDTLYAADADTWTKALAIGRFVASNVPHDNQKKYPEHVNAIGLWEYTKNVAPAFNCRLHSILTFELMLAAGLDARYVTCLPEDKDDSDCHVVNEVWLPELGKWAMIDTDMDGHYFSGKDGVPLSLKEIRDHYISGEEMILYPQFRIDGKKKRDHLAYMAKNTYWFSCWANLSYYQEDKKLKDEEKGLYINLVPSGFVPFRVDEGEIVTTDADRFWAAPEK